MAAFLLLTLALQDNVRDLVEKLRSESVEERDDAVRRLKAIGKPALPELEKASKDPDAEVVQRARGLLRTIRLQEYLTPPLVRFLPELEARLSQGDPHAWLKALVDASLLQERARIDGGSLFEREDLEGLVPFAATGAATAEERMAVCSIVRDAGLRRGSSELAAYLSDSEPRVRMAALVALATMPSAEALKGMRTALRDADPAVQAQACASLSERGEASAVPDLMPLLKSPSAYVRGSAARALAGLGAAKEAPAIADLLDDPVPTVRYYAALALRDLGFRGGAPRIRRLLGDEDPSARSGAIRALAVLEGRDAAPALLPLTKDRFPLVRMAAADVLCGLGVREAVPEFLELWRSQPGYQGRELRLDSLNGVRRPETWARLSDLRAPPALGGTREETRARLEKAAEMTVKWPGQGGPFDLRKLPSGGRKSGFLLEAIRSALPSDAEIIVESDRLRFLPTRDAEQFWEDWWRYEPKGK